MSEEYDEHCVTITYVYLISGTVRCLGSLCGNIESNTQHEGDFLKHLSHTVRTHTSLCRVNSSYNQKVMWHTDEILSAQQGAGELLLCTASWGWLYLSWLLHEELDNKNCHVAGYWSWTRDADRQRVQTKEASLLTEVNWRGWETE